MDSLEISSIASDDLCAGCGTCAGVCPNEAIKMHLCRDKGIFIPKVNKDLCNQCGICYKVCPGHEVDFNNLNQEIFGKLPEDPFIGNYKNFYVGYSLNDNIRFNSASGGLVTQFLIFALEEGIIDGALVTRMDKNNPLMPEPIIARTKEEIIEASGSKYCPVPINIILRKILEAPDNEKFAVVGLPCHIHGIRKAESIYKQLKEKIKFHIGIICNHTPTFHATKFILKINNLKEKDIIELNYRGCGWPGMMEITNIKKEKILIPHFAVEYWGSIFNSFFFPSRCTVCTDKSCKLTDITFADAWTPEFIKKDKKGTSLLVIRKEIELNAKLKNKINLNLVSKDIIMKSQNLDEVKKKVLANIEIKNALGKKTPIYCEEKTEIGLKDYYSALISYSKNYLSKSPFLVKLYMNLYQKAFDIKSKFTVSFQKDR